MKKLLSIVFILALIVGVVPSNGYSEGTSSNGPSSIRILEVQPAGTFILDAATLKGNSSSLNVTVDKISMSLFIANRDKLNGKYDLIYFGQRGGTYVPYHDASLLYSGNVFIASSNVPNSSNTYKVREYLSPNDITNLMADEVSNFLSSGQPVVFDESIFTSSKSTILKNTFKSVASSNKIVSSNVTNQSIIGVINNIIAGRYSKKPQLKVVSHPLEFSGQSGSQSYLTEPEDRYMRFNLSVSNTNSAHSYKANLYLDLDSNNLFEASKGELVQSESIYNENLDNVLIRYNLPKAYIGYVSWKIEVVDLNTGAKSYELGNTAFKYPSSASDEVRHIRVLQIAPNSGNSYNLKNLPSSLTSVDGLYDIQIDVTTVGTYNSNPYELNGRYDMVVLGFKDSLAVNMPFNQAAINRIKSFIDSGQSLLTTHDQFWFMLSDKNNSNMTVTKAFRNEFGQNIYNKDYISGNQASVNSTMLTYPSGYNGVGFSDRTIKRASSGLPVTSKALKTNEGQINSFPFALGNQIGISGTHFQYFKLDMEREDLIVWYTLYGSGYNGLDPRNDYYVYSIGNITYSGTGHQSPGSSNDEKKLFVNTMLKASRTANHSPSLEVEGLADGFTYYKTQSTINFNLTVEDMDLTDITSDVKVYIDSNKDGVGDILVNSIDDLSNGRNQQIILNKSAFNNLNEFDIIVEATDSKGAKSVYTAEDIKNIDDSTLVVSQGTSWNSHEVLVGDTGSLQIELEKTGTGNIDFQNISVSVSVYKSEMDNLCSQTALNGWIGPILDSSSGKYNYTKEITALDNVLEFAPVFDRGVGELTPEVSISYTKFDTDVTSKATLGKISVAQGQFIVSAMDRYNRPIANQEIRISKDGTSKSITTNTDNIVTSFNTGSGAYTVSYDLSGYKNASLLVTYADGSKQYFEKPSGSNTINASIQLNGSNSPADISLVLYQDTINGISIDGDIKLITANGLWQNQQTTVTAIDTSSFITASYQLDKDTKRIEMVLDDAGFKGQLASGTGSLSYGTVNGSSVVLLNSSDVPVTGALVSYNSEHNSYVITPSGDHFTPAVYKLKFQVDAPKGMQLGAKASSILVKSIVTDVYVDANDNGAYEENELYTGIENLLQRPINITYTDFSLKDLSAKKSGNTINVGWSLGESRFSDSIFDKFIVEESVGERTVVKEYPINTFNCNFELDEVLGDRTYKVSASGPNGFSNIYKTTFVDAFNNLYITGLSAKNNTDSIKLSWNPVTESHDRIKIVETVDGKDNIYYVESGTTQFDVPLNGSLSQRQFKIYVEQSGRTSNPSNTSWNDGQHAVLVNQISGETGKHLGTVVKLGLPNTTISFEASVPGYKVEDQAGDVITVAFENSLKTYNIMYIENPNSIVSDKSSWPMDALDSIKKYAQDGKVDFYDDTYYDVIYNGNSDKESLITDSLLEDFMRILKQTGAEKIRDGNGSKYLDAILNAGSIGSLSDLNDIIKEVNGPVSYTNKEPHGGSYTVLDSNTTKISHDSKFGVVVEIIVEDTPLYDPVLTCTLKGNEYLMYENPTVSLYAVGEKDTATGLYKETKISSSTTIIYDSEKDQYDIMLKPTNLTGGYLPKGTYYAKIDTRTLVNSDNYTISDILKLDDKTKDKPQWQIGYFIDTIVDKRSSKKITEGMSMFISMDYKATANGSLKNSRSDDIIVSVKSKKTQDGGYTINK